MKVSRPGQEVPEYGGVRYSVVKIWRIGFQLGVQPLLPPRALRAEVSGPTCNW